MTKTKTQDNAHLSMTTLPGDDIRQIMWRFSDRYDLQMVVQSARSVARGLVARLVAEGTRNTHEWNEKKGQLLAAYDESGLTAAFMDPEHGGYIPGPKNLTLALVAYELSWVDAGAATCSLAGNLALAPIHEKGTQEQKQKYMSACLPPQAGEKREPWRGAFVLTEPIPYVGVDAGMLGGRASVAEWKDGKEPMLQIEKRGRFITNMAFANFVTAAVDSGDERIKGSCMVILENTDPGTFDAGSHTLKLVHQLSSTCDPIFSLKVPASRIIGGYTIQNDKIVPNYSHSEVIEAVFKRTRVTVALMSSAKLLSAVEPIMRYQRQRFRGGSAGSPGTPRYDLGLQQKEDALHRLVDIWATGEASASLGFAAARFFDDFDVIEKAKEELFQKQGIKGARAQLKAFKQPMEAAKEYLAMSVQPESERDSKRFQELEKDTLVQYLIKESVANVLCPACKLWNTGHGANTMREAVSLMGGYGITEDCPGFLGHKWMDAQLEATYEGPEAVQRRQLSITMTNELFLEQLRQWILEMRKIAGTNPETGACTLASAMNLWLWSLKHLLEAKDANGRSLYHGTRHGVTFPFADALCWLLGARHLILDVLELREKGADNPVLAETLGGTVQFFSQLSCVQSARAAGEASRIATELVFGYNRHPSWQDASKMCYESEQLDSIEYSMPGICSCAQASGDVIEKDGAHPAKAGPCVRFSGLEEFNRLRTKLDGCLTGARLAKDQAADAITKMMIPEALDYPS